MDSDRELAGIADRMRVLRAELLHPTFEAPSLMGQSTIPPPMSFDFRWGLTPAGGPAIDSPGMVNPGVPWNL